MPLTAAILHTHMQRARERAHTHTRLVVSMTQHVSAGIGRALREGIGDGGEKQETVKECEEDREGC